MVPGEVPGSPREILGDPRGLPGSPGGGPGSRLDSRDLPLGAVWALFRVPVLSTFSSEFRGAFFNDLRRHVESHFGSVFGPQIDPRGPWTRKGRSLKTIVLLK